MDLLQNNKKNHINLTINIQLKSKKNPAMNFTAGFLVIFVQKISLFLSK